MNRYLAFQQHQNYRPNPTPKKIAEKLDFPFSNDKTLL